MPRRRWGLKAGERSFVKNVATFMGGRSAASAITLLLTPIIARLFAPHDFGAAALFLAVSTTIGPLSCAAYERAVPVAKTTSEAIRLAALCVILCAAVSFATGLVSLVASVLQVAPDWLAKIGPWLWLLPFAVFFEGMEAAANSWLLRHQQYRSLAAGEVAQALARSGMRIGSGLSFGSSAGALNVSYVSAFALKVGILLRSCRKFAPLPANWSKEVSAAGIRQVAKAFSDFPTYNLPTGLLMSATKQLPVFVLATAFGPEMAGFFAMADRITRAPVHVATNTLRQVFLQKLAEIWNSGRSIRVPLFRTLGIMSLVMLVPFLVIWLFGEELLTLLLGQRWNTAGKFVEILAPYLAITFLAAPLQAATAAMRLQKLWFWLQVVTAGCRLAIIPAAAMTSATPAFLVSVHVWATVIPQALAIVIVVLKIPPKGAVRPPPDRES